MLRNKIVYSLKAMAKITNWVDICPQEISGLGTVEILDDGTIYVSDAFLLKQQCTPVETELDQEAIIMLQRELGSKRDSLRLWWHSHVNMGVFWSGTDKANIRSLKGDGFFLHTVFNKKGESKTLLEISEPYCNASFDDLDITVDHYNIEPYKAEIFRAHMGGNAEVPQDRRSLVDFGKALTEDLEYLFNDRMGYARDYHDDFCQNEYEEKVSLYVPKTTPKGARAQSLTPNPHRARREALGQEPFLGLDGYQGWDYREHHLNDADLINQYAITEIQCQQDLIDNSELWK